MTMGKIKLSSVTVNIPIFNSQGRSLKKTVIGMATGGKIGLTESGKTIVKTLDNINLEINEHERVGLIGHNGAGKSSLLRVIGKVYEPSSGSALVEGSLGSLIDISLGIDPEATGIENIYLRAALLGIPKKRINAELSELIEFTQLGEFVNMPVRTYSTGMHMRLAFAVSTMIRPDILLMDEWLSVGDQDFQSRAEQRLTRLIKSSNILVIASHSRSLIERCCTRVIWLEHGTIKMDGKPSEICSLYFG
jgi:O-antigen export system, ATP-binding protein